MRYFYTKLDGKITLAMFGEPVEFEIGSLEDARIKPGSIEPFTRYTGWLELADDAVMQLPLAPDQAVSDLTALPEVPEQRESEI